MTFLFESEHLVSIHAAAQMRMLCEHVIHTEHRWQHDLKKVKALNPLDY